MTLCPECQNGARITTEQHVASDLCPIRLGIIIFYFQQFMTVYTF